ncbi:uncharacterized protein LOC129953275 [Eupeodes corollae]|uniref:uncharacterized protein LOC129953275 n=1 Tax=Eupeodes corollae TaxID=290404 RepID=UPI00249392AE|nr:uncharacterized protein LOC129953275 [Eupeodes corollae]
MCSEGETDRMVQCDSCDKWYHYDCVGVDDGVADVSWSCEFCTNPRSNPITTSAYAASTEPLSGLMSSFTIHPQTSSSPSTSHLVTTANAQPNTTTGIQVSSSSVQYTNFPSYLPLRPVPMVTRQSHLIPEQHLPISYVPSGTTALFTDARMSSPINFTRTSMYTPTMITWATNLHVSEAQQHLPATSSSQHEFLRMTAEPATFSQHASQRVTAIPATLPKVVDVSLQQKELQMEMLEEEKKLHQRYLERKYQILSSSDGCSAAPQQNNFHFNSSAIGTSLGLGPSPAQIAARQVLPKQLPIFSGDPEEWPLFLSSFNNSTALAGYSDAENLMRLQASLKGKAREIVRNKLLLPSLVPEIIQTLKMCFGRPEYIIENMIDRARKLPPPKDKLENIIEFALSVSNICSTMEACQMSAHLNNPMLVKEFVDKLPSQYKLSWAMQQKEERVPIVKTFSTWLHNIAEAASQVVSPFSSKKSGVMNTHTEVKQPSVHKTACIACNCADHKISNCGAFKKMTYNKKWEMVKANKLCRQCLNSHRRRCNLNSECGVESCKAKHHPLLHKPTALVSHVRNQVSENNLYTNPSVALNVNTHSDADEGEKPYFRIIPVRLHSKNIFIDTFAFLDEGSSVTLIERSIFETLGLSGVSEPLCLRWTGDTTRVEENSIRTSIEISNKTSKAKHTMHGVHTVEKLSLPMQSLDMDAITQGYPYLADLPIQSYQDARPTILIGVDNWKLAVPLKVREGSWNQPIATKTRLGWTLQGCVPNRQQVCCLNIHACNCDRHSDDLHEAMKAFFKLESSSTTICSHEDKRVLQILESTCKSLDNQYEIGLPWRHDNQKMPDSYKTAFNRLMCLQKKFKREANLKDKMQAEIDNLLIKGYASKLNVVKVATSNNPVWYLPIFVTQNPNKPNRVRLVWDAAAKSNGRSLNDFLLTGPDLLTSLVEVLLAFRIGQVAICGDIAEMFHQIKVREQDMHAQRFLWWEKEDPLDQPSCYVMSALTFGMNCAPCIAHYIRNKNADQFQQLHPRAVEAIKNYHYVDDFIDSVDTEEEALCLANDVKTIHLSAGFNIRNWASNSSWVVHQLTSNGSPVQAHKTLGSTEKVLGMYWDPNNDVFKYIFRFVRLKRDVLDEHVRPTKRETLQVLMSIFDPLGFVTCFTIGLKILLQEVWRSGIDWDGELSEDLYSKWLQWKSLIPSIKAIEIPRCYSRLLVNSENVQIHTFVDAGEHAYAAVCYLRVQRGNEVSVALVASKSKVAPLKPVSIPRLELQAAVLGIRLSIKVQAVRRLPITSRFWWSDSKTVLKWLRMDPRKFQQFVMFRVGEILEHSNAKEWKWVPSKLNTADLATKVSSQINSELWFTGPKFLAYGVEDWPTCDDLGPADTTEVRHHLLHATALNVRTSVSISMNVEYFSDWRRLYRALATFKLYIEKLKAVVRNKPIPSQVSYEILQDAKVQLYKCAQMSVFSQDISNLERDGSGILRIRSRAENLNNQPDAIVLPKNHHVTFLIVRSWHENHHHVSHETTINKIRGMFYIPRLRVLYKSVRKKCQRCKNYYAMPAVPQMATLPAARLAVFERPFTFVGIDYFGPISTIIGRRREKRWGVIFTCLTVRAVHIEVAHSLDTSSCIMCIRNFISRRGMPREIYTDNGTNFKATEKILCDEYKNINYSTVASKYDGLRWKFNPPAAPHMGGAWERLVRSIKTILYSMAPRNFNDETLRCALWEVEFLINSRPLTFVSLESCDDEAITPNHLLLGSTTGYKPICENDIDLRQRWHQTQVFADRFWQRWVKDYTPMLARRGKWFEKQPPLAPGDVVVIVDENLPRNSWPKGIIESVVTAKDGQVRRAMVKTQTGMLERPTSKIAVLDVDKG